VVLLVAIVVVVFAVVIAASPFPLSTVKAVSAPLSPDGSDGSDNFMGITEGFSILSVVLFTLLSTFPSEILI
jgi:hypothetical protein